MGYEHAFKPYTYSLRPFSKGGVGRLYRVNKLMIQLEQISNCGIIANVFLRNLETIDIKFDNFIMFN